MIEQFHNPQLGHASYLVTDPETRISMVVDPPRDVSTLLEAAAKQRSTIAWVLDTHGHNDYLSGLSALIALGATALAPIGSTVGYDAIPTRDGHVLELGPTVEVTLLHTPGHTPEHTAVRVRDGETIAILSGGSLLVGDVGRPDLLGGPERVGRHATALASTILDLVEAEDDDVLVLPTHVAGSLCAGAIAPGTSTTIGEQRSANQAIASMLRARDLGIEDWLDRAGLPPVPKFWPTTRAANMRGVAPVERFDAPCLAPGDLRDDDVLLDVRDRSADYPLAAGAIELPPGPAFTVWAGMAAHGAPRVILVADDADRANDANAMLLDVFEPGAAGWVAASELATEPAVGAPTEGDLVSDVREGRRTLVDVRNPAEVREQPMPGAVAIPGSLLLGDPSLAPDGPLALACVSGYRARVVASALRRAGIDARAIEGSAFELLVPASIA